jgi:hypothetical protein
MMIGKYPFLPRLRSVRVGGPDTKKILASNFRAQPKEAVSAERRKRQGKRLVLPATFAVRYFLVA